MDNSPQKMDTNPYQKKGRINKSIFLSIVIISGIVLLAGYFLFDNAMQNRNARLRKEYRIEKELLSEWMQSKLFNPIVDWHKAAMHSDNELNDAYLVFNMNRNRVYFEKDGKIINHEVDLIDKYDWKLYQVTPDGLKEMSGIVRLKNRHDREVFRNICKEAFVLQTFVGKDHGVQLDIKSSNCIGCGNGNIQLALVNKFFDEHHYEKWGETVNKSVLVSEEEYLEGNTLRLNYGTVKRMTVL
jgi:hypothetical protein